VRRFVFVGEDSSRKSNQASKFWEIGRKGSALTIRFGPIGANGQTTLKEFATPDEAKKAEEKSIAEKLKKGYVEESVTASKPKKSVARGNHISKEAKQLEQWIAAYGIHAVMDAEDGNPQSPATADWDLARVWTCWDTYDEAGSYVSPGFYEVEDLGGDPFVTAWFLGTKDIEDYDELVTVMDRRVCDDCDTEGCDACDDIGWVETDYQAELQPKFERFVPHAKPVFPARANFCTKCGNAVTGKFCSNCGQPTESL
jgi:predicted DNA-binding WGR domain protein